MTNFNDLSKQFKLGEEGDLGQLSFKGSLNTNLKVIKTAIQVRYTDIERIAVWIYDEQSDRLKAFLSSQGTNDPLAHSAATLSDLLAPEDPQTMITHKAKRLVRHLEDYSNSELIARLLDKGFKSSYLAPIIEREQFIGLIVLSSTKPQRFDFKHTRVQIDFIIKLIALLVVSEIYAIKGLKGTAQTLKDVASLRDNETGEHLERMSRFSRLIAVTLAKRFKRDDEYAEDVYQASPLHDIGKVAIPDSILLKEGALTDAEFEEMKKHASLGKDIIQMALKNLHMEEKPFSKVLVNIVYSHHENWDGSGYPQGLKGNSIPLEARIARVADVYDALTSTRPYKKAWSSQEAIEYIEENSGTLFDPDCAAAVRVLESQFLEVVKKFQESEF